ncbi:MAG: DoxX family protein [Gemmatimonadota bacterium]|nr:DoxX family protein [Gemmatimonadota bacterium]
MDTQQRTPAQLLSLVLSVVFLVAGGTKLVGLDFQVERFATWGLPGWWFIYVVGGIEVIGATLLVFPRTRGYGAGLLVVLMLSAISTHVRTGQWAALIVPVVLLVLLVTVMREMLRKRT